MSDDDAADLDAVNRYLGRFRKSRPDRDAAAAPVPPKAATTAGGADVKEQRTTDGPARPAGTSAVPPPAAAAPTAPDKPKAPVVHQNQLLKVNATDEDRHRRNVARVAGLAAAVFVGAAIYAGLTHRNFTPLSVGSNLFIEIGLAVFPEAWPLAVLHDVIVACAALMVLVAVTTGHVGLPGNPALPDTYVWRRQTRFAWPRLLLATFLAVAGVALEWERHPVLAAFAESPAFVLGLAGCSRLWIPIARNFIVVQTDWPRDGLSNRIYIGGGLRGFRHGTLVILHQNLLDVRKTANLWEWCFGLAALELRYRNDEGQERVVILRALGSAALVQQIEIYLKGPFKAARVALPGNTVIGKAPGV